MRADDQAQVLVVDDDERYRAAVLRLLAEEGIAAVGAPNGRAAIDHLLGATVLPRLVLLDLNMPVMSGWETVEILRRYLRLAPVPIVLLTGEENPNDPVRTAVAGTLSKLVPSDRLIAAVRQYAAIPQLQS